MWWRREVISLLMCLLFGSFIDPVSADTLDRIIAYVNDDIITLSELNERTNAFVAAREQNPFLREEKQGLEEIRHVIMDSLINELLTAQEVARLKISVSDAEVDAVIAMIMEDNRFTQEALEAQLRIEGKTIENLRLRIRQDLEQNKLINREVRSKTVVTDELVEAYYESSLHEFQEAERWRLHDIFLPFPAGTSSEDKARLQALAKQIHGRLSQGADFAGMARRYSQGPGAEAGGDLGYFSKGELDPVLEKAIAKLEPGAMSPVIQTAAGLHIIKVVEVDRTPAKSLDEVRENIRRTLYQREIDFRYREWLSSLRERSYVKIVY